jgi:hypothetical protein
MEATDITITSLLQKKSDEQRGRVMAADTLRRADGGGTKITRIAKPAKRPIWSS